MAVSKDDETDAVDLEQAQRFLALLDSNIGLFSFLTHDEHADRDDPQLRQLCHGDLSEHGEALVELNRAGAGVWVAIHLVSGPSSEALRVHKLRGVWHVGAAQTPRRWPLPPHLTVETEPGRVWRLWLSRDLDYPGFGGIMNRLIGEYASDPQSKNLTQALRLPGSWSRQDPAAPFQARLLETFDEQPYPAAQLLMAFPPMAAVTLPGGEMAGSLAGEQIPLIREALACLNPQDSDLRRQMGLALYSTGGGPVAFALWDDWCQANPAGGYDAGAQAAAWQGFGQEPKGRVKLDAVFQVAQVAGWKPPTPAAALVVDITQENAARQSLEREIAEVAGWDDPALVFPELVYRITPKILKAPLRPSTKAVLLKQIAKATGVPATALRADTPKLPKGSTARLEDPKKFMRELNGRHAVISLGGQVRVMNRDYDPGMRRHYVSFSTREDFLLRYENRTTRSDGETESIAVAWLRSPDRRQYDGITFLPGDSIPGFYNLWTGWGVKPKPGGSCLLFQEFVFEVICCGDLERYTYVWGWLAHLFQKPRELPETMLVLMGDPGIGKNTFVEVIGKLVGSHYIALTSLQQVVGRFSGHLADTLLVFANEAIWGGDKAAEGTLKAMVTDSISNIEAKGKDIRSVPNFKRVIVASNEDWPAPRGRRDRRLVVLEVSESHKEDRPYFAAIKAEMEAGGYEALLHTLMHADLTDFHPARIPAHVRETGWELTLKSAGSVEKWWYEMLLGGWLIHEQAIGQDADEIYLWPQVIHCEHWRNLYLKWCEKQRVLHPEGWETLGKHAKRFGLRRRRKGTGEAVTRVYLVPGLPEARENFQKIMGLPDAIWQDEEGEEDAMDD